ncbi:MAG: nucleotidyl transferase AbiEii/AbiGii toxin family protein [Cytophagales bacterium]|nr:nucleotidyl transferase AbiEii/AbiGii toxin family protein [Cytophagales bacterium]
MDFLSKKFEFISFYNRPNCIIGSINKVKTDFITHNYKYVLPPITEEGITYLSKEDIAAMKLNAITRSGKRLKDFIDIYYLLQYFSIDQMMQFFQIKYPLTNPLIALKCLVYFDDIDPNIDPPKLMKPIKLQAIKTRILDAVLHSQKVY